MPPKIQVTQEQYFKNLYITSNQNYESQINECPSDLIERPYQGKSKAYEIKKQEVMNEYFRNEPRKPSNLRDFQLEKSQIIKQPKSAEIISEIALSRKINDAQRELRRNKIISI
ncbi:hypothetical protein pb186bvf_015619 [Paramecium bursaria]